MRVERERCNEMAGREREEMRYFTAGSVQGQQVFWGRFGFDMGEEGGIQTGGKQVARDEQGVLHGHYARSCPSRNPDPARTLLYSCTAVTVGFI